MGSLLGYAKGELPMVKAIWRYNEAHEKAKLGYRMAMPLRLRILYQMIICLQRIVNRLLRPINKWEACNKDKFDILLKAFMESK